MNPLDRSSEESVKLLEFMKKSPTSYQAAGNIRKMLLEGGFEELPETSAWSLVPGGRYFTMRGQASVIAFSLPENDGDGKDLLPFMTAAAHADSPAFKIKVHPEILKEKAYVLINIEKYGGMLLGPWFDRPLSAAGRALIRQKDGSLLACPVDLDRDLFVIPSLAIHMDRAANDGHKYSVQSEMLPLFGDEKDAGAFLKTLADALDTEPEQIVDYDLYLYVREPGRFIGNRGQYILAGRIDDLQCAFALTEGFLRADRPRNAIPVLCVFNSEEVGSGSREGAGSTFLPDTLQRISIALGRTQEEHIRALSGSMLVSADNAHAVHPAWPGKADPVSRPKMNEGIVFKYHAGQRYTTDAVSSALFRSVCEKAGVPVQEFTNHADQQSGSTLGSILLSHLPLHSVDIGLAQLAMHSPMETAGALDTAYLVQAMKTYFSSALATSETRGCNLYRIEP